MTLTDKQRSRKHKLISYLLDNSIDLRNRLQVAYELESRFDCDSEYSLVPNIIKALENEPNETPPLEYYVEEYDYDHFTETTETPEHASARDLLELDYKSFMKNKLIQTMSYYLEQDETEIDTEDLILDLRKQIDKYDSKIDLRELETLRDLYEKRKNQSPGLRAYVDPIDYRVDNFEEGMMSVIGGYAGDFKTTLALAQMYNNVIHNGKNCVFISIEMKRELILYKLLARHSFNKMFADSCPPVTDKQLRRGDVTDEQEEFIFNTVWDDLKENDTYGNFEILGYDDFRDFTTSGVRSRLSRLDFEIDGLFVDYIQELKFEDHPFKSRNTDPINHYVRSFSKLTDDVDGTGKQSHVVLLSQVNQSGYERAKKTKGKYEKNAVSEAHAIEREASILWFTYANEEHKQMGQTRVILAKNRHGEEMEQPETINIDPGMIYTGDDEEDLDGRNVDVDDIF